MAISATIVDIRGKAFEPVITEILFQNKTVADNLVNFVEDVKANTIFTENTNTVSMQAYVATAPGASGSISLKDTLVTPVKVMYYDEFNPETLRTSRFNRTMAPGAWNIASTEFDKQVLNKLALNISADMESKFWNGALAATKSTVAGLTGATNGISGTTVSITEQAKVAAMPTNLFDSVPAFLVYNNAAVGARVPVTGTTITSSNIFTEYSKLYAAIPAVVLDNNTGEMPYIYAPKSHKQLINIFNVSETYRNKFAVEGDKYFFNGIEIVFVPLAENTLIAALPSAIHWCTDIASDMNFLKIDKINNNREDQFYKVVASVTAHCTNQKFIVLYA